MEKNNKKTAKSLFWGGRRGRFKEKSCEQLEHKNDDRTQNVNREKKKKLWKNSNYINTTPVLLTLTRS